MNNKKREIRDEDDYPTDKQLKHIKKWKIVGEKSIRGLLEYIYELWEYADIGYYTQKGRVYKLSTGGWSGNEDIICAMEQNFMFWNLCSYSWRRGGHYVFKVPKIKGDQK